MTVPVDLATIAFNRPRLIAEQIRLLLRYLDDPFTLTVFDNSTEDIAASEIQRLCDEAAVAYERLDVDRHMHHAALNYAAERFRGCGSEFFGFLDHDVFPTEKTSLLHLIKEAGFYGIGQRAPASGWLYLWPGFCFFARAWVGDRTLDFGGADGGDTGSALSALFAEEDWQHFFRMEHGYRVIRDPDEYGLQSYGYEVIGPWIHFTNGSDWMTVPDARGRERLLFEVLAAL